MNKEFIPYGKALSIEELGYDGNDYIAVWYHSAVGNRLVLDGVINDYDKSFKVPALTYSQAFRWFREKYRLQFWIEPNFKSEYQTDGYVYYVKNNGSYSIDFATYEEAELACLKKLIEIVKNK